MITAHVLVWGSIGDGESELLLDEIIVGEDAHSAIKAGARRARKAQLDLACDPRYEAVTWKVTT